MQTLGFAEYSCFFLDQCNRLLKRRTSSSSASERLIGFMDFFSSARPLRLWSKGWQRDKCTKSPLTNCWAFGARKKVRKSSILLRIFTPVQVAGLLDPEGPATEARAKRSTAWLAVCLGAAWLSACLPASLPALQHREFRRKSSPESRIPARTFHQIQISSESSVPDHARSRIPARIKKPTKIA